MIQPTLNAYIAHKFAGAELEPGLKEGAFYDPVNFTFPAGCHICEVEVDPQTGIVSGDASRLQQIVWNLLANAIKFTRATPQIHVCAEQKGQEWVFGVRDNGIGIEPQYTERIFEVFRRLHTRSEYPGTGIGLAICKKVIETHGGRMWIESEYGKGSTFYFTLPDNYTLVQGNSPSPQRLKSIDS